MTDKTTTEHRIVCAKFGTTGHSSHEWVKKDLAKAKQSIIDLNHQRDTGPATNFYRGEAPYRLQSREVTKWKDESDVS